MKSRAGLVCLILLVAALGKQASAIELNSGEDTLNVNGRIQLLGALEIVDDEWNDSERVFMFLKQARINLNGEYSGCDYGVQWQLGGEEIPERNSVMSLLDAYVNVPLVEDTFEVKMGQFKVPYGRERLSDSGSLLNTDRSIQNNFFNIGRDVGGAVHTTQGNFTGALGVFTGGGVNIPERYIPEDLELPMTVLRVGINNGLDKDVFTPYETENDQDVKYAAYINAAYTKDSRVGHSTPLNVKYHDKSLMLDGGWNPYIGAHGEKADFYQAGADAAIQFGLNDEIDILLSGEVNYSDFKNDVGSIRSSGGVASIDLLFENLIVGIRYAVVDPDDDMAYTDDDDVLYPITDKIIQEITPSVVYFLRDYNVKLTAEVVCHLDVPVSLETGNGVYDLMRQSDQVSYVTNGGIELQDTYLANFMVQYSF